ncbi:MAG: dethiobiotin synthase [Chthoniobacterales bacterium]
MSFFVTGIDTAVGKTHVATQLLLAARAAGLRCAGMKPICCGDRADAEQLLAASSDGLTIDEVNPIWFKTPAAPFAASLIEQTTVNEKALIDRLRDLEKRFEVVVVEGVGGWLVPIRANFYVSDLAAKMGLPVLIIAMNRLGCLNHTMLTVQGVKSAGLVCAGVVMNELHAVSDIATNTNIEVLRKLIDVPVLPVPLAGDLTPKWMEVLGIRVSPSGASSVVHGTHV